ncbi:glycoside hydrolase family 13 protein [Kitasatospora sp. NPDC059646]|uniref:glycoside hydrolase family 13 protein n=1 Tax=Kitasatospora sp. NPDC059646 TaxID=3346893 RepID=UPI0036964F07
MITSVVPGDPPRPAEVPGPSAAATGERQLPVEQTAPAAPDSLWWRDAVIYQVYVRSFQDSNGDGIGDLPGVRARLPYLKRLGVDGIWLNPFYPSPQHDHGYDVADYKGVDPMFGSLEDFDLLVEDCRKLGLRLVLDTVPNHCSTEHPWFQDALLAAPGSPERARFHFADGRGTDGELPPNNWRAMFGGPAWSRITEPDGTAGQWYLHMFTPEQPDLNWRNPEVPEEFEKVLRFWLDRGVDGFRIDVAAGLFKHPELPDSPDPEADERTRDSVNPLAWNQPEVHDVWRSWRSICEEYTAQDGRQRLLVGEASVPTPAEQAKYVRADELHQAFFFHLLHAPWDSEHFHQVIDAAVRDITATGSTVTWVLNNHDQVRTTTRFGSPERARAAALLMLSLPGAAYLYQGEELGLPEVDDLPDDVITDPIFFRTGSRKGIRDGCRVPLPWSGTEIPFGFGPEDSAPTWLPQPPSFAAHTAERALTDHASPYHLYREALHLRRLLPQLGEGTLRWLETPPNVLAFTRGDGLLVATNFGTTPAPAPVTGTPLLSSAPCPPDVLPPATTAWWIQPRT